MYYKIDLENLYNHLNSDELQNKLNFGYNPCGWNLKSLGEVEGNTCVSGNMGSGKTELCKFLILSRLIANNSKVIVLSWIPQGYELFQGLENFSHIDSCDESSVTQLFKNLYEETIKRQVSGDYHENILFILDGGHALINKYSLGKDPSDKNSLAYMFDFVLNEGSNSNINIILSSQRMTLHDVPENILSNLENKVVFRSDPLDSMRLIGSKAPSFLKVNDKGIYFSEKGCFQVPRIDRSGYEKLISMIKK